MFSKKIILVLIVLILLFSVGPITYAVGRDIGNDRGSICEKSGDTWECECQVKIPKGKSAEKLKLSEVSGNKAGGELGKIITDPICAFCGDCTLNNFLGLGINVSKIILKYLGVFALLMFIIGGLVWITSGGASEKVQLGKKIISGAVVGIVIVLGAVLIVRVAGDMLGVEGDYLSLKVPGTPEKPERPGVPIDDEDFEMLGDIEVAECVRQKDLGSNPPNLWCAGCTFSPLGCKGADVSFYQTALADIGYSNCGESEVFDMDASYCTLSFQEDYNSGKWNSNDPPDNQLRTDGIVDDKTLTAVLWALTGDSGLALREFEGWETCTVLPTTWRPWCYGCDWTGADKGCRAREVENYEAQLTAWGYDCGIVNIGFRSSTATCTQDFQTTISNIQSFYLHATPAENVIPITGEVDYKTYLAYQSRFQTAIDYIGSYRAALNSWGCDCGTEYGIDALTALASSDCNGRFEFTINELQQLWIYPDTGINYLSLDGNTSVDENTLIMYDQANDIFNKFSQEYNRNSYSLVYDLDISDYSMLECSFYKNWGDWPDGQWGPDCPLPTDEVPWCYGCLKKSGDDIGCQSDAVANYQTKLNFINCNCGSVDGKFGQQSEDCTRRFQNTINWIGPTFALNDRWYEPNNAFTSLDVTGEVDASTWQAYNEVYLPNFEWYKVAYTSEYIGYSETYPALDYCKF